MNRRDDELHQLASFMVLTGLDQLSRTAAIQHPVQQDRGILTTVTDGGGRILRWSNCRQVHVQGTTSRQVRPWPGVNYVSSLSGQPVLSIQIFI
jgi:hypothetical protein